MRADDDSHSDDSTLTEVAGERRKKSKAVYEKSPIKPERFPGKDFNRWELWVKHYKSVAKANGWSDQQAIAALPACLTSWAVEEFETVHASISRNFLESHLPLFLIYLKC